MHFLVVMCDFVYYNLVVMCDFVYYNLVVMCDFVYYNLVHVYCYDRRYHHQSFKQFADFI